MRKDSELQLSKEHHFFDGSYSDAQMKINELKIILDDLKTLPQNRSNEKQELLNECDKWLVFAEEKINKSLPQLPFGFDSAYAALHKIRHNLCILLPIENLFSITLEIETEIGYVADIEKRHKIVDSLKELNFSIVQNSTEQTSPNSQPNDRARLELQHLSMLVGQSRETIWHKVNLLRTRLLFTLLGLIFLLIVSIPVLHYSLAPSLRWYHILGIQLLGAIGGAMSAIRIQEKIDQRSTQYYLKQTLLYLRPAVGAAAGLALALAQLSGVVTFFTSANHEYKIPLIMFIAFLGGFSERFFLRKVDQSIGSKLQPEESKK